jgi:tripartite-type tricarboxylate transporter receptor subunit TctC
VTEFGFPTMDPIYSWYVILVTAKIPKQVVTRLNSEIKTILGMADVKEKLAAVGAEVSPSTPEETGKFLKADLEKWDKMMKAMKAAGLKLE